MTRENESPIVIYEDADKVVEVRLDTDRDTVWLTQRQMAEVFDTSSDNVSLHLKNIYGDEELEESATTEDSSVVRQEGKRQVVRSIKQYNLDAIISLGYRVNSRRASWTGNDRSHCRVTMLDDILLGKTRAASRLVISQ